MYFFKLYSCSWVFASIFVTKDFSKNSPHVFNINFSTTLIPWSKKIAPSKASSPSLIILSSDLLKPLYDPPVVINFFNSSFFAISKQVFLFTRLANFLSMTPSFSSASLLTIEQLDFLYRARLGDFQELDWLSKPINLSISFSEPLVPVLELPVDFGGG